jgi:hexosaminidase
MLKLIPYPNKVTLKEGVLEKPYKINEIKTLSSLGEEGYKMTIDNDGVTIKAVSDKGLFYGKQTLKQLEIQYKNALPFLEI